uniref:Ig-like domain-containing protein n=1 Tax=Poecilia formosa TaxID=48698 RepID=A0A096LZ48_POEFO
MRLLLVTLILLRQGYALVPAITVQLGEPVTFTCGAMESFQSSTWLQWYKQSEGDTLKLMVMQPKNVAPSYGPEFPTSRFRATNDGINRKLTILRTVQQDEGMYHCALIGWTESIWAGTYLMVEGNTEGLLNSTIVQKSELSEWSLEVVIFLLFAVLTVSLTVIVVLICVVIKKKSDSCQDGVELYKHCSQERIKGHENKWIYSAVIFTVMKQESGPMNSSVQRERIYTAIKAFG